MIRVRIPGTDASLVLDRPEMETPEVRRWLQDAAAKIGRQLARRERRVPDYVAPEKPPVPSVAHHKKERRAQEREEEYVSLAVWTAVLLRSQADHRGKLCCEACGRIDFHPAVGLEPHHLVLQSRDDRVEWVMALCADCHRLDPKSAHRSPRAFVQTIVIPWLKAHGYAAPNRKEYRTP